MLIENSNNELIIKIPSGILSIKELQGLLDFLRYKELTKKSKAKKHDLLDLVKSVKNKRKV